MELKSIVIVLSRRHSKNQLVLQGFAGNPHPVLSPDAEGIDSDWS